MAKVLLAKPVGPLGYYDLEAPDLGLGYLATALKRAGHHVRIVDCVARNLTQEQLMAEVEREQPAFFGLKIYTKDAGSATKSLSLVKERFPGVKTLLGGPFPSGAGADTLSFFPDCDFAFAGESEMGLPKFVELMEGGAKPDPALLRRIPGLVWRSDSGVQANPSLVVEDLDSVGYPDWEALEMADFIRENPPALVMKGNYLPIITGRGCPYKCTYCAGPLVTGKTTRHHSIPYVVEWIRYFIEKHGAHHFSITDDNFLHERLFVRKFCQGILDAGLEIKWECGSNGIRLNQTDEETLRLMEDSGCYLVSVGIESGSPKILKAMKRSLTINEIRDATNLIRKTTRFWINGFFIMGYPEETMDDLKQTLDFALELPLDRADFFGFTPHPGTEAYRRFFGADKMRLADLENFRYEKVSGTHPMLPVWKLRLFRFYALLRFYLRPRLIVDILSNLNSIPKVKRFIEFFRFALLGKPRFRPAAASRYLGGGA